MKSFSLAGSNIGPLLKSSDWLTVPVHNDNVFFHGDPHPTNIVFDRFRHPKAIIDFELATLGSHDLNLVSLIFNWAPLEPQRLSCWRNIRNLSVRQRAAIMLERWQPESTSGELIDLSLEFIAWRRDWVAHLARLGNRGAQQLIDDPEFDDRYAHAITLLKRIL
jgi:aminoglycoside phosphotransferase (APT) family kinase protein